LLTESTLLALGGALTGAAVGYLGMLLWRQIPIEDDLGIELMFEMDRRVLLVNLGVAMASVFMFGLTPVLRASRASHTSVLRSAGSGRAARSGYGYRLSSPDRSTAIPESAPSAVRAGSMVAETWVYRPFTGERLKRT